MFFVYILKSLKDGKKYIGYTSNLEKRLEEHHAGQCASTKHRRPLELIHREEFETKKDAMLREKFFKSGKGREYLNSFFNK